MTRMWIEVWGRYSHQHTTKVLARLNMGHAEITRRQEREALKRIRACTGDVLECYSRPEGWTGRYPTVLVVK